MDEFNNTNNNNYNNYNNVNNSSVNCGSTGNNEANRTQTSSFNPYASAYNNNANAYTANSANEANGQETGTSSAYGNSYSDLYGNQATSGSTYSSTGTSNASYNAYNAYGYSTNTTNNAGAANTASAPNKPKKEKKKGSTGAFFGKTVAAALVFGLVGGCVFTGVGYAGTQLTGSASTAAESSTSLNNSSTSNAKQTSTGTAEDLTDVSSIVEEVMPSIVAITNTATVSYNTFYGQTSKQSQSCGSGIIVSEDDEYLYIATNNHVVADSESLTVQFCDEAVVEAEVRGTDADDDLAVVRVKKSDMESDTYSAIKVATIGDSDAVEVGSAAIAIGNALGYGQSVTTGIISALNRTVTATDSTTGETVTNSNLIQTDAAINPGNSGGALLNASGEVIGINSVKYSSTDVEGIGYAIPMSYAQPILESLINSGEYTNENAAYLGIKGGDVESSMQAYGIPAGVYITGVTDGSGAAKAGLAKGDIITAIEGTSVSSMTELKAALKRYSAGDTVTVTVERANGGEYQATDIEVTLSTASEANIQTEQQ